MSSFGHSVTFSRTHSSPSLPATFQHLDTRAVL